MLFHGSKMVESAELAGNLPDIEPKVGITSSDKAIFEPMRNLMLFPILKSYFSDR